MPWILSGALKTRRCLINKVVSYSALDIQKAPLFQQLEFYTHWISSLNQKSHR